MLQERSRRTPPLRTAEDGVAVRGASPYAVVDLMRPFAFFGSSCLRAVCAALAICTVAPGAAAEDKGKDKAVLEARQKFRQAIALQTGGNWAAALALFREVAAVKNTPQVLFNIAICEENLGQLVQALGDYQLAATQARDEGQADVAGEVDGRLTTLQERIPKVTIKRGTNANLAKISIDGVEVGAAMIGQPMPVDPGGHSVGAELRGYQKFEKAFDVAEKQAVTVEVALEPAPNMDSPYGSGPEQTADKGPAPQKGPNVLPWVIGGVGAASLVASGVFFILRQGAISDLDSACPSRTDCPPELEDKANSGRMFSTLSMVTLAVGVVGVGTGVTLLVIGNGKNKSPEAALTLGAPNAHAGATFVGRF